MDTCYACRAQVAKAVYRVKGAAQIEMVNSLQDAVLNSLRCGLKTYWRTRFESVCRPYVHVLLATSSNNSAKKQNRIAPEAPGPSRRPWGSAEASGRLPEAPGSPEELFGTPKGSWGPVYPFVRGFVWEPM